jgi:hypothetical protein
MMTENTTDCIGDLIVRDTAHVASTRKYSTNFQKLTQKGLHFPK